MAESTSNLADLPALSQEAFAGLVLAHRRELRAHCYRMLGSLQEADDLVQETLGRAWDRRATYAGRGPLRAWLYRIATNLCIDELRQTPRRGLPVTRQAAAALDQPIPASLNEPIWLEPFPVDLPGPESDNPEAKYSLQESVQLAFLTALHLLPPRQRAVLILADVLDWPAAAVAEALEQSLPSVKSALHRARVTLARHYPAARRAEPPPPDAALQALLDRYVRAWETADVEGLVALLKADCTFSMPPIPSWYRGRADIAGLVAKTVFGGPAVGRWRLAPTPTRANGQPGFGLYRRSDTIDAYDGYGVQVVVVVGGEIADITTFRDPRLLAHFDLPPALPA